MYQIEPGLKQAKLTNMLELGLLNVERTIAICDCHLFRLFLELDLVFQSCQTWIYLDSNNFSHSTFDKKIISYFGHGNYGTKLILPTYEQILTITKFVA
jgi:hypothetical protein